MPVFAQFSPRQRLIGLGVAAALLSLAAWQFSFSRTLDMYRTARANTRQLAQAQNAESLLSTFRTRLNQLEHVGTAKPYDREILFEEINTFCRSHQLQILRLSPENRKAEQNIDLVTNQLEVQGSFNDMVQLGWFIEREQQLGKVVSATYAVSEDKRTHTSRLIATFILQHIVPHDPN
ncbi:MAG: hypothetical protein IT260_23090 [Saprospiraceae bacterium]|nr:hypothetical protein [Saprospiraceae bacterium]